ncbi:MAG TPA: hypothetical protein VGE01_07330, partial [Fimbriimonas sp.]
MSSLAFTGAALSMVGVADAKRTVTVLPIDKAPANAEIQRIAAPFQATGLGEPVSADSSARAEAQIPRIRELYAQNTFRSQTDYASAAR